MKLGAVSRHLVGVKRWSLQMIAKSVGVSTASVARGLGRGEGFGYNAMPASPALLLHVHFESTVQLSHKRFDLCVEAHYSEALWKDTLKDF
jgi:hypothetical protein